MLLPSYWIIFAFGVWGLTVVTNLALAALAALGVRPAAVLVAGFLETLETLFMQGVALIETGYQKVPALIMVLSALLVLPAVALVSFMVQRKARRRASAAAVRAAQRRAEEDAGDWTKDTLSGTTIPAWTSQAWLTIEGRRAGTVPLAGQTIRIGRHEDNDIRLTDSSVHRYHAVIQRMPGDGFVITNVSGKDGNGVRINGARAEQAQLADGDVIELGRAKLKFENAPV